MTRDEAYSAFLTGNPVYYRSEEAYVIGYRDEVGVGYLGISCFLCDIIMCESGNTEYDLSPDHLSTVLPIQVVDKWGKIII